LDALEVVWELTVEWNTAWESYKTGEFWTTDIKEMEDNVSSYAVIIYSYIMQVVCYSFALLIFLILEYMLTLNATCTI
jgi:hypothetical protein